MNTTKPAASGIDLEKYRLRRFVNRLIDMGEVEVHVLRGVTLERLQREIKAIVGAAEMREKLLQNAFEPIADTPGDFTRYLVAERVKWTKVVREGNVRPE